MRRGGDARRRIRGEAFCLLQSVLVRRDDLCNGRRVP